MSNRRTITQLPEQLLPTREATRGTDEKPEVLLLREFLGVCLHVSAAPDIDIFVSLREAALGLLFLLRLFFFPDGVCVELLPALLRLEGFLLQNGDDKK